MSLSGMNLLHCIFMYIDPYVVHVYQCLARPINGEEMMQLYNYDGILPGVHVLYNMIHVETIYSS